MLEKFKSLQVSATFLLSQLPLLKPRLYSVSSSLDRHPNELHLTVSVVEYHSQGMKDITRTLNNSFIIKSHVSPDVRIMFCSVLFYCRWKGPMHFGTCSTWLNTIKRGHTVPCFVHRYWKSHKNTYKCILAFCILYLNNIENLTCLLFQLGWIPSPRRPQHSSYSDRSWQWYRSFPQLLATTCPWHEKDR